jgi:hypothetical protein
VRTLQKIADECGRDLFGLGDNDFHDVCEADVNV